jgi:Flp pilus assembly protein TadG
MYRDNERGAVLVYVSLILLMVMGLTAFVLDYGIFWLSRHQAQNAADSGALAGAIAHMFDETTAPAPGGPTETSATHAATSNLVMGTAPSVAVDYTCPSFATTMGDCVRVDTFRDGAHSNPLPTYFANLWGITSQDVQATATAQVRVANASSCVKPWLVIDETPPYSVPADIGRLVTLTEGLAPGPGLAPSFYQKADLCPTGGGVPEYADDIRTCYSYGNSCPPYVIGGTVAPFPGGGGAMQHFDAVMDIINQDLGASWNGSQVVGSCAPASCSCTNNATAPCANGLNGNISPRIITVMIVDPADITSGRPDYHITNMLSFFLLQPVASPPALRTRVEGIIVPTVGLGAVGGSVPPGSSFLHFVSLIR